MKKRHDDMASIDDFLEPLLSGDLLREYSKLHGVKDFRGQALPVNFKGGHSQYYELWRYLFLYEVFNVLVNSRRADAKEEEHADAQNRANSRSLGPGSRARKSTWPGYAVCGLSEGSFETLRLYHEPPHANRDATAMRSKSKFQNKRRGADPKDDNLLCLRSMRDDDLVVLSETAIDLQGKEDIK